MNISINRLLAAGAALGAIVALNSAALAQNTVYLETGPTYGGINPYQDSNGGEFTALLQTNGVPNAVPSGYNSAATFAVNGVTGFETFCVEDTVDFWVGTTYDYQITPYIQVPTGSQIEPGYTGFTNVPLAQGTAWLYEQFATGQLNGYDYTNTADRLSDAGVLQQTIWYLQGETAAPTNTVYLTDLLSQFTSVAAAQQAETTNQFGVNVLDLYSTGAGGAVNGVYQDQLILGSVPDGAATVVLLGISLLTLAFFKRRSLVSTA